VRRTGTISQTTDLKPLAQNNIVKFTTDSNKTPALNIFQSSSVIIDTDASCSAHHVTSDLSIIDAVSFTADDTVNLSSADADGILLLLPADTKKAAVGDNHSPSFTLLPANNSPPPIKELLSSSNGKVWLLTKATAAGKRYVTVLGRFFKLTF
jgi:hypothetical protein